ncbi:putative ubiquitin-conjugating enzyme E2 23 [Asimina triloba]
MRNEHDAACGSIAGSDEPMEVGGMVNTTDFVANGFSSSPVGSSESKKLVMPKETAMDLHNEMYVYRQDVVKCKKHEGLIGIVTEVAGDSDSDGSITDDDSDDSEEGSDGNANDDNGNGGNDSSSRNADDEGDDYRDESLQDCQVRVAWLDHTETTSNRGDIVVVDRGFLHGDIVAATSDPTGQVGVVLDVNISVNLLAANGTVIKDVSSKHLQRVTDFTVGDYVVSGPWLGRVDDVLDNVTVLFDDGSICKIMKADPSRLKPVSKNVLEDANFPYHPGQRVKANSSSVFKNARWLCGVWKANRLEGTVVKVEAGSVFVYWIASASPGYGTLPTSVPLEEQKPKDLTLLSCFAHANWQLGDWCLLPSSAPISSITLNEAIAYRNSKDPIKGGESPTLDSKECADNENEMSDLSCCTDGSGAPEKSDGICEPLESGSSMDLDGTSNVDGDSATTENNASIASASSSSLMSVSKEPVHENWLTHRKKIRKIVVRRDRKGRKRAEVFERALLIINTLTKVDVAWQDGTREFGRDSKTLIPISSPGDHEFYPEQYVVEKASNEGDDPSDVKRMGVVRSVNAKDRTACVRWLKPVSRPEDPREFDNEEVVSVYELDEHPDYDYCYGDVVVRLSPVSMTADTTVAHAGADRKSRKHSGSKKENKYNDEDADFLGLSWVGNITGLQDGDIEVTWADGMVSKVGPQAIYVVGRDDDEESIEGGSEVSDDGASWETVEENEMRILEIAEQCPLQEADLQNAVGNNNSEAGTGDPGPSEENHPGRNGPLSIPRAALGFVTRLATGFFFRGRKHSDGMGSDCTVSAEPEQQESLEDLNTELADKEFTSQDVDATDNRSPKSTHDAAQECGPVAINTVAELNVVQNVEGKMSEGSDDEITRQLREDSPGTFKRFDIAKDPLDHYYRDGSGQNDNSGRKWVKKVHQDWSILEKNLPDGIYVRVYEDRMDLLRAVIVGAYGTPYQDGLFFFDFHLPPEYPQVPPSAYYHSGGLRLNPNLYEDGKVCLSLLNTWTGKGNEVWDSSSSSILQVLVSLQGLVLNSKPYFNEAGYDKQVGTAEGEKNSLSYNENTFLLNCKSMLYLLRRPPMHFEELVRRHFQSRGYYILKACNEYMEGCLVGSLTKDAGKSEKSGDNSNSVGFKLMLAKIIPRLASALAEVGLDSKIQNLLLFVEIDPHLSSFSGRNIRPFVPSRGHPRAGVPRNKNGVSGPPARQPLLALSFFSTMASSSEAAPASPPAVAAAASSPSTTVQNRLDGQDRFCLENLRKEEEEELHRLLVPDPLHLPPTPPSAIHSNFVSYFAPDFLKPGHDQYVYRHANGLCVIGVAPTHVALASKGVTAVDFNVGKSDRSDYKVTGKRKKVIYILSSSDSIGHMHVVAICGWYSISVVELKKISAKLDLPS